MDRDNISVVSDRATERRARRFRWPLRITLALIVLAVLVLVGISQLNRPYDRTDATYKNIVIEEGAGLSDVAALLDKEGIIGKASRFELLSKLTFSGGFRPGTYFLSPSMDSISIIKTLNKGLTTPTGFTIPAGYTIDQIATALERDGLAGRDAFLEARCSCICPYRQGRKSLCLFVRGPLSGLLRPLHSLHPRPVRPCSCTHYWWSPP